VREHLRDVDQAAHLGEDHELGDLGEEWEGVVREVAVLIAGDQSDHQVAGDHGAVVQKMHLIALVPYVDAGAFVLKF